MSDAQMPCILCTWDGLKRVKVCELHTCIEKLDAENKRLREELEEARKAARWMMEGDPTEYELKTWPWLEDGE